MSVEKARKYLEKYGLADRIIVPELPSATVETAALALGCEPAEIAKSLSFKLNEGPLIVVAAGTARIDNRKFKETFHQKASMIPPAEVEELIGYAPGGVCPFDVKENVRVCLDQSLKAFETVYPAAGDAQSGVRLSVAELERACGNPEWVDVTK